MSCPPKKKVDVLVCLNEETYKLHKDEVKDKGMVILDTDKVDIGKYGGLNKNIIYVNLPFAKIMKEAGLAVVMMNNIALGVLTYLLGADVSILNSLITEQFAKKGGDIIDKNIQAAHLGFESVKKSNPEGYSLKIPKKENVASQLFISGNEMFGLGSISAGCKFYVAYPMTPS